MGVKGHAWKYTFHKALALYEKNPLSHTVDIKGAGMWTFLFVYSLLTPVCLTGNHSDMTMVVCLHHVSYHFYFTTTRCLCCHASISYKVSHGRATVR